MPKRKPPTSSKRKPTPPRSVDEGKARHRVLAQRLARQKLKAAVADIRLAVRQKMVAVVEDFLRDLDARRESAVHSAHEMERAILDETWRDILVETFGKQPERRGRKRLGGLDGDTRFIEDAFIDDAMSRHMDGGRGRPGMDHVKAAGVVRVELLGLPGLYNGHHRPSTQAIVGRWRRRQRN